MKKNDHHLIAMIQTIGYMLMLGHECSAKDKRFKDLMNDNMAFLKLQMKKVKKF